MTGDRSEEQRVNFPSSVMIQPPTADPLHSFISSERYVESLESKLKRMKGKSDREPSSKEMLKSLEKARDSQMEQFMQATSIVGTRQQTDDYEGSVLNKDYSGKQQSKEEIVALLHHDELAKINEHENTEDKQNTRRLDNVKS